jgi:hypothetical protein
MDGSSSGAKLAPITETQVSDPKSSSKLPGWAKHIVSGCAEKSRDGHECLSGICLLAEGKSVGQRSIAIH